MEKIITFGFQQVVENYLKDSAKQKGKKLAENQHVFDVIETNNINLNIITAKVIPQTKVNNAPYETKVTLDCTRLVKEAVCSCGAGLGGECKHIAAVIFYVNSSLGSSSKTDDSQAWDKPSQLKIYKKGCTTEVHHPAPPLKKRALDLRDSHYGRFTLDDLRNIPCALKDVLKTVAITKWRTDVQFILDILIDIAVSLSMYNGIDKLLKYVSLHQEFYPIYINSNAYDIRHEEYVFYVENVKVSKEQILDMALKTITQSSCPESFSERKKRISGSLSHKILHSKSIEKLADSLLENKPFSSAATSYGIKKEKVCLSLLSSLLGKSFVIIEIGVIIKESQPWLCCSPDGLLMCRQTMQLLVLEIKCPYSCRNVPVYNSAKKLFNVPYLFINENNKFSLKESHQYFTQVQILLYVSNVQTCQFVVYSPMGSVILSISRDEAFMKMNIPKLEKFYFKTYLKRIALRSA